MYGLGHIYTHILQIYWINKYAIDLISVISRRQKVRFRKKFKKMKYEKCSISWCWKHTLPIILGGFTAQFKPWNWGIGIITVYT